ncbi:hypothetical protein JCM5350_003844 [Sporobolomyces pararoseus]
MSTTSEEPNNLSRCSSRDSSGSEEDSSSNFDAGLAALHWVQTTEDEAYELIGLKNGAHVTEVERRISNLLRASTDSLEDLPVDKRNAIVTIIELEMLQGEKEVAQNPRLQRVYTSLASHRAKVLAAAQRVNMDIRIPDKPKLDSTVDQLRLVFGTRKRGCGTVRIPIPPLNLTEARRILGVEENATETEMSQRLKSALESENSRLARTNIIGAAIRLGTSDLNALSPASKEVVKILSSTVNQILAIMLDGTNLNLSEQSILCDAVYRRCEEAFDAYKQIRARLQENEDNNMLVMQSNKNTQLKIQKLEEETDMARDKQKERDEDRARSLADMRIKCNETMDHFQKKFEDMEAKTVRMVEDRRLQRQEDQKEIGRLRGQVKALEKVVEQFRTEKRKKEIRQEKKAAKSLSATSSPLIDYTIQRQAAEIIELKRQLEEEKMKSLQQQIEETHLDSPTKE